MKLWDKGNKENKEIRKKVEIFTVGKDRHFDVFLAKSDVLGNIAHATMLQSIGLLEEEDFSKLKPELISILKEVEKGNFYIEDGIEDVHSQIEYMLTKKLGDAGKKIHSGRSRNDQVLVDLKLFLRDEIELLVKNIEELFILFIEKSNQYKDYLLPGYTHYQIAMPSSFGLWFGAYAESLSDDLLLLNAAYRITNQNPLGSAAGYGSSFPLNRKMTTHLLGFEDLSYNVVYAQMGRGKVERTVAMALSSLATTLSKMAMDAILYMCQNFAFISFPEELTTGSSIMPHKKNPDVFEIIRGKCNRISGLPNDISLISNNLPHGYHREMQLLKELLFPAFSDLNECIAFMGLMMSNILVKKDITSDEMYKYIFSVESLNNRVLKGQPFRDAYIETGNEIESGNFNPETSKVNHTHEGSIGNLCNEMIEEKFFRNINEFNFERSRKAIQELIKL
jgi:argininosuccinate lyase